MDKDPYRIPVLSAVLLTEDMYKVDFPDVTHNRLRFSYSGPGLWEICHDLRDEFRF